MKKHKGFRIAFMILIGLSIVALLALAVMALWNWLIPAIFAGGPVITYWQALGLMVLAKILFGGLKPPHRHPPFASSYKDDWKQKLRDKWNCMDPEKKEKIRNHMFSRFHGMDKEEQEPDKPE